MYFELCFLIWLMPRCPQCGQSTTASLSSSMCSGVVVVGFQGPPTAAVRPISTRRPECDTPGAGVLALAPPTAATYEGGGAASSAPSSLPCVVATDARLDDRGPPLPACRASLTRGWCARFGGAGIVGVPAREDDAVAEGGNSERASGVLLRCFSVALLAVAEEGEREGAEEEPA